MSANTKIEWATHTFNPWVGCMKISPACDHCYAEGWAKRSGQVVWGGQRKRTSIANWRLPVKWGKQAALMQSAWAHGVALHGGDEAACIAAGYIKPQRPKVFCASLADVFDNAVDPQWRADLFRLIIDTPNLDWLLLTKRIGNAKGMIAEAVECPMDMMDVLRPLPNVWLGATICNQAEADRDIPKLMAVPAAKRFLSMEPLLGSVDLSHLNDGKEINEVNCLKPYTWDEEIAQWRGTEDGWEESFEDHYDVSPIGLTGPMHAGIDWVIVGGESGPNARPMHPDHVRSLRDQCEAAGVPFIFKQWGNWRPAAWFDGPDADNDVGDDFIDLDRTSHQFVAVDGRTWDTFGGRWMYPPMPLGHWCLMVDEGKKAAGRLIDGREWNGVPT